MSQARSHLTKNRAKGRSAAVGVLWWVIGVSLLVMISLFSFVALVAGTVTESFDESEVITDAFPDDELRPPPGQEGTVTILLLGSDTRGEVGENLASAVGDRSDAILLARISGDREKITLISIMRDS